MMLQIRGLLVYTVYTIVGVGIARWCSEGGNRKCGYGDGRDQAQYRSFKKKNGIAIDRVSIVLRVSRFLLDPVLQKGGYDG